MLSLAVIAMVLAGSFLLLNRMGIRPVSQPVATLPSLLPSAPPPTALPLALPTLRPAESITTFVVPTAGIQSRVVEVFLDGISWDVSRLGYNVGHLQGTAAFGATGNLVLAGHGEMADGRPGVFAGIEELRVGDPLILSRDQQQKQYVVSAIKTVAPDDLSVLYPTEQDQLTLVTCDNYNFIQNTYLDRIVVIARRAA